MKMARKSDYSVHKLLNKPKFPLVSALCGEISASLYMDPEQIGYFVPGYGLSCKKEWLKKTVT